MWLGFDGRLVVDELLAWNMQSPGWADTRLDTTLRRRCVKAKEFPEIAGLVKSVVVTGAGVHYFPAAPHVALALPTADVSSM